MRLKSDCVPEGKWVAGEAEGEEGGGEEEQLSGR